MHAHKLVYLFVFILILGSISAQEIRFTGERDANVTVCETCSFLDTPCSASFACNMTIMSPSQQIIILNEPTVRNQTLYCVDLNSSQSSELGVYEVQRVYCSDGEYNGSSNFFYQITPNGSAPIDAGSGPALFGILIVLIFSIIFFLVLSIFTKNIPFKIFFTGMSILLMIGTLGFGVTVMQQVFATFAGFVSTVGTFYRILVYLSGAAIVGLMVYLIVVAIKTFKINRGMME